MTSAWRVKKILESTYEQIHLQPFLWIDDDKDDKLFFGMVDRREAFILISSRDHCQRSSPPRISNSPQAGFEPAQNMISGFVEWNCAVVITTTPRYHIFYLNKNWNYVFSLFLYCTSVIQKTQERMLHKWGFIVFCSKKKFLYNKQNQTGLILFTIQKYFLSKKVIFFHISKIFFTC